MNFQMHFPPFFFQLISLEIDLMAGNILNEIVIKPHLSFGFKMAGI